MDTQPFYHLRPNKYIDRQIFVQMLNCLAQEFPINHYKYIGFGSFLFDDFKLIHNSLGITKMISLESDKNVYHRALYNKPYNCIKIINTNSADYIAGLSLRGHTIIWLDYTMPGEIGIQFSEFCSILNIMRPHDILKITLNATPATLGAENATPDFIRQIRLDTLTERIGNYLPIDVTEADLTFNNYPKLLVKCLKKAAMETMDLNPPYQNKYFRFLLSTIYQDGQQMLTLTGMILEKEEDEEKLKQCLVGDFYATVDWDKPCHIKVPALTSKEILHINRLLPNKDAEDIITKRFLFLFEDGHGDEYMTSYLNYYKYYPNFHHVNL